MSTHLRHKTVVALVVYNDRQGFLLWNNPRWGGYALPMRGLNDDDDPVKVGSELLHRSDLPLSLPQATCRLLETTGAFGISDATREETYYDYNLLEVVSPGEVDARTLDPNLRFFTYEEAQDAINVTWSTKFILKALVERQEVIVAIICRKPSSDPEYFLILKQGYGKYFFPSIRRKSDASPEELAVHAVRLDTGYDGHLTVDFLGEVTNNRESKRFGNRQREFCFHVCRVDLPGVDYLQPDNALEMALKQTTASTLDGTADAGNSGSWGWFASKALIERTDVSPDVPWILPRVT